MAGKLTGLLFTDSAVCLIPDKVAEEFYYHDMEKICFLPAGPDSGERAAGRRNGGFRPDSAGRKNRDRGQGLRAS